MRFQVTLILLLFVCVSQAQNKKLHKLVFNHMQETELALRLGRICQNSGYFEVDKKLPFACKFQLNPDGSYKEITVKGPDPNLEIAIENHLRKLVIPPEILATSDEETEYFLPLRYTVYSDSAIEGLARKLLREKKRKEKRAKN